MELFGHPLYTLIPSALYAVRALGSFVSGVRGLRGRDVWMAGVADDPHASVRPDFFWVVRGRAARWTGLALAIVGVTFAIGAVRVWP
jgi:hypothetical protein